MSSAPPPSVAARMLRIAAVSLVLLSLLSQAASAETLQQQLERLRARNQRLEQEQKQRAGRLEEITEDLKVASVRYSSASKELERARADLARKEQELREAEARVRQADLELKEVTERLARQQQQLGRRAKSLYMDGRVEYLEVLLGATSFGDFITRFRLLQAVVRQDSRLVMEVKATRAEVEFRRQQAREERDRMVALRTQARQYRDRVSTKVNEVARLKSNLSQQADAERRRLDQLERESKQLEKDIRVLEEKIAREVGQLSLSYPVSSVRITSTFRRRFHPILREWRMHNGVDFGARTGDKVMAAADGTVIVSQWQAGYGYVVVISHGKVKGKAVSTLYAHNSKLKVAPGQQVKRGQVIALAGSTGLSTGPHVHFEVRVDGKPVDPMPWLGK